jgi:adenine-specific DNA-methyltransferase
MPVQKLQPNFNLEQDRIEMLKQLIPEAVSDGKIDWDVLKEALGEYLEDEGANVEHFGLSWAGKREARRLASMPSKGTLVPVLGEGIDEDTTGNIFIEGDNLEVLKLLQKSYAGRIKMIYIDPPYNTGNDFIYKDDFSEPTEEYLKKTGQADEDGNLLTSNPKSGGRFHSNWLNMMYPRLRLARNLLKDDGVIFISIDDNEVHNLRALCTEIFGEENFIGQIVWKNATDNNPTNIAIEHEYLIVYSKDRSVINTEWKSPISDSKNILIQIGNELIKKSKSLAFLQAEYAIWFRENKQFLGQLDRYKYIDFGGVYTGSQSVHNPGKEGYRYDIIHPKTGKPCKQPLMGYRFPKETMDSMLDAGSILFGEDENKIIELKVYAKDFKDKLSSVNEIDGRLGSYDLRDIFKESTKIFNNPKPLKLLKNLFSFVLNKNDLILDFFAGSGTTSHAILELNKEDGGDRKFICVQLPELTNEKSETFRAGYHTIAEISKERIRRVIKKIKDEQAGKLDFGEGDPQDLGFKVYKLDRSNLKIWKDYDGEDIPEFEQLSLNFQNPLGESFSEEKVVTEIQLLEGFPLDSKIKQDDKFVKNKVLCVTSEHIGHRLFICLDSKLDISTVQDVRLLEDEDIFICLDNAITDQEKMMLADGCNVKTI